MFEAPKRSDVERHLDLNLRHAARREAQKERGRIEAEAASTSAFQSSRRVLLTEQAVDDVHATFTRSAAAALQQFAERGVSPKDLVTWAQPRLDMMNADLLAVLQNAPKFEAMGPRPLGQFQAIFDQRTNAMLRDFEVGIVNGVSVPLPGALPALPQAHTDTYIASSRIEELKAIKSSAYDVSKLIQICEELNSNWRAGSYLSIAALLRMLLDHVPPVFAASNFAQVIAQASKSSKNLLGALDTFARNIADLQLHEQIGRRHILPAAPQVDLRAPVDHLLSEVLKRLI